MYIEDRLFSETSDEVLYSVTMTEDEYDLFSEFQKEFASVRKLKKATWDITKARATGDRELMGKAIARMNREGLAVNSPKYIFNEGFDKVVKSNVRKMHKLKREPLTEKQLADYVTGSRGIAVNTGLANIKVGNKAPKL